MGSGPLSELIANGSEILLMALTPPRLSAAPAEVARIADVTLQRLADVDVDGLVLYDIDDESDRNPDERPFPYLPTLDPGGYYRDFLTGWQRSAVIYRCVGKYPEAEFADWLRTVDADRVLSVFVGSSSADKRVRTSLTRAHQLRDEVRPGLSLGGVTITERYTARGDEHLRMLAKQERGASFFISQVVYDVDATKSLTSDYFYECLERGVEPRPILFTMSVCGSVKTLSFLQWLGVDVPRWLVNSLERSPDPLTESYRQCLTNARELIDFCRELGMPFGFTIESVSNRKLEIEASVQLAREIRQLLN